MKFKVGDRIRVYGAGWFMPGGGLKGYFDEKGQSPWTATVKGFDRDMLIVHRKLDAFSLAVYPQQCRKLKSTRKRIWFHRNVLDGDLREDGSVKSRDFAFYTKNPGYNSSDWLEFIEVKKKCFIGMRDKK